MGLIGYALKKLLKKKKEKILLGTVQQPRGGEEQEDRELGEKIWQANDDIERALRKKGIRVYFGTSIYTYLLDPEEPEKSTDLLEALKNKPAP